MLQAWSVGPLLTLVTFSFFNASARAALINVTVDDTFGNPQESLQILYRPTGAWSPGQSCTGCEADIDATKVLNGTWHDTTYLSDNPPSSPLTASLEFDGVAIYVYCIVTRSSTDPFGNSDMTFYLDGVEVGKFIQPPNGDPSYQYNFPVYVNESIPAGSHSFMLVNGRAGGQTALALLDYIVFSRAVDNVDPSTSTIPSSTSTTSSASSDTSAATASVHSTSSKRTAVIAGIAAAAVLVFVFAIAVLVYCTRRRRSTRSSHELRNAEAHVKDWMTEDGSTAIDSEPCTPQTSPSSPLSLLAHLSPRARAEESRILNPYPVSLPHGNVPSVKVASLPVTVSTSTLSQDELSRDRPLPSLPNATNTSSIDPVMQRSYVDFADGHQDNRDTVSILPGTEGRTHDVEEGSQEGLPSYAAAVTAGGSYVAIS